MDRISHRCWSEFIWFAFYLQIVVLLVGTNNTSNSAEEVAEGIFEIVKTIREKLPDAYIVLPVINEMQ